MNGKGSPNSKPIVLDLISDLLVLLLRVLYVGGSCREEVAVAGQALAAAAAAMVDVLGEPQQVLVTIHERQRVRYRADRQKLHNSHTKPNYIHYVSRIRLLS